MKISLFAGCFPVLLGACAVTPTALPDVIPLQATTFPNAPIVQPKNKSVVQGYEHRAVTDPKPWRELNDQQAPGEGT
ncbi:MAG: hypothetical protein COB84_08100 [Rhodobacteraceae bacterium]|nr:MAG: hypothetical protein COB84_08100 [Paracoccaceae bacterium]